MRGVGRLTISISLSLYLNRLFCGGKGGTGLSCFRHGYKAGRVGYARWMTDDLGHWDHETDRMDGGTNGHYDNYPQEMISCSGGEKT